MPKDGGERVIVVEQLAAKKSPLALSAISFTLRGGIHALLGGPMDGGALLLDAIAGRARVRAGKVLVQDRAPGDASTRREIALVPREPLLPDALTVGETLRVAAEIRGEPPPDVAARLEAFGIASLASRKNKSLAQEEARAVALCEAAGSSAVQVLLVDEPLVGVDARATGAVRDALRAKARAGACVLFATASPVDASALASSVLVLARGRLVATEASPHAVAALVPRWGELRIVADDARALLAALAKDTAVTGVETRGEAVVVRGPDLPELAAAVTRAAVASGASVRELRVEMPSLEELQGAAAGAASAAYQAAYAQARAPRVASRWRLGS